jgi:surfactin synthase thioesterase subunit
MYRDWMEDLRGLAVRPVERPGRGTRLGEKSFTAMTSLVENLIDPLLADVGGDPYVLMGHSVGGLIAFELAHAARELGAREPQCVIVSGHPAPDRMQGRLQLSDRTDEEILSHLRVLGGTSDAVLDHPLAARLFLPAFRADSALGDTYRFKSRRPLEVSIAIISASDDPQASVEDMYAWRAHTVGVFTENHINGDHFALFTRPQTIYGVILDSIAPSSPANLGWKN